MEHLQNFKDFLEETDYQQELGKATSLFAWKPFAHRYKDIKNIALVSRYVLPVLSIATGAAFLYDVLQAALPIEILALLLSVLVLTLWELAKASLIQKAFINRYSNPTYNISLFVLVVALSAGSIYASVQGASLLHKRFDHSVKSLIALENSRKEALSEVFNKQIDSLQQVRKEYKESVSYQEHINIHNKANQTFFRNNDERIRNLEVEKAKILALAENEMQQALQTKRKTKVYNQYAIMILAFCIDLLIVLSGWFLVYYPYNMVKEVKLFTMSKEFAFKKEELQNIVHYAVMNLEQSSSSYNSNLKPEIGFQRNVTPNTSKKHPDLISAIKAGERDYRTLCKKYKVNPKMVKECMEQVGE